RYVVPVAPPHGEELMRTLVGILALGLALPALAQETKVKEGDLVPDVTLPATGTQKEVNLRGLKGKNLVLFFYPKAMTPGCPRESCGFRDVAKDFTAADTVVLGISTDKLEAQEQFTKKEGLNYLLLADSEMKVAKALGVLDEKRGLARRVTFVIDKE